MSEGVTRHELLHDKFGRGQFQDDGSTQENGPVTIEETKGTN